MLRRCLLPFQVPASGEDDAACLPEQEWGGVDSRQQELYRMAVKGSYEAVVSLGEIHSLRLCQTPSSPILNLALHKLLCYLDVWRTSSEWRGLGTVRVWSRVTAVLHTPQPLVILSTGGTSCLCNPAFQYRCSPAHMHHPGGICWERS